MADTDVSVNGKNHQEVRGEAEPTSPDHHEHLAHHVPCVPLEDHLVCLVPGRLTSIVTLQMVSMGRVMKQVMQSAMVRWYTR